MAVAQWCGPIMLAMKVNGNTTKPAAKVNSFILMVIFTMVSGLITRRTGTAFTPMLKELVMKDSGRMTNKMERVLRPGLRELSMKEST